mmetsp:Transcript_61023/g.145382  ORF Transcript_61023/g.145382 Transcript_61023/m.145382 type:complete len:299 (+) Transcript_61023:1390-2286(+)
MEKQLGNLSVCTHSNHNCHLVAANLHHLSVLQAPAHFRAYLIPDVKVLQAYRHVGVRPVYVLKCGRQILAELKQLPVVQTRRGQCGFSDHSPAIGHKPLPIFEDACPFAAVNMEKHARLSFIRVHPNGNSVEPAFHANLLPMSETAEGLAYFIPDIEEANMGCLNSTGIGKGAVQVLCADARLPLLHGLQAGNLVLECIHVSQVVSANCPDDAVDILPAAAPKDCSPARVAGLEASDASIATILILPNPARASFHQRALHDVAGGDLFAACGQHPEVLDFDQLYTAVRHLHHVAPLLG